MLQKMANTELSKGKINGTDVLLLRGKRVFHAGGQALVVPSWQDLRFPKSSAEFHSKRGLREEIFDAAGYQLKVDLNNCRICLEADSPTACLSTTIGPL